MQRGAIGEIVKDHKQQLLDRIGDRSAQVAMVELVYVGLPMAVGFAETDFRMTGIDLGPKKVAAINTGENYIGDVVGADVAI